MLRKKRRKTPVTGPSEIDANGSTCAERRLTEPLPDSDSSSEHSSSSFSSNDNENHDEAIATESEMGTGNDLDEYDLDASDSENERPSGLLQRAQTTTAVRGLPFISRTLGIR